MCSVPDLVMGSMGSSLMIWGPQKGICEAIYAESDISGSLTVPLSHRLTMLINPGPSVTESGTGCAISLLACAVVYLIHIFLSTAVNLKGVACDNVHILFMYFIYFDKY